MVGWTNGLFNQMVENAVSTHLAHVAIQPEGYQRNPDVASRLPEGSERIFAALAAGPGSPKASTRVLGDGLIQSSRRALRMALVGVVPWQEREVSVVPAAIVEGRYLDGGEKRRRRLPDVVIGKEMAERLKVDVGDKLVIHVPGEGGSGGFRVVGLYRTPSTAFDRTYVYVTLNDAQALYALGPRPTQIAVSLDEPEQAGAFRDWAAARIDELFPGMKVEVLTWQQREPRLAGVLSSMDQISWVLYAVIFVAMAFGIANALLMAVYERIREFGVLRSIGLQGRRLVAMILLEALLLTGVGTAVGLALGLGLVGWLGQTGIELASFSEALGEYGIGTTMYPQARPGDVFFPVQLAVTTALVAALWPALKAYRLRPAEALRHV